MNYQRHTNCFYRNWYKLIIKHIKSQFSTREILCNIDFDVCCCCCPEVRHEKHLTRLVYYQQNENNIHPHITRQTLHFHYQRAADNEIITARSRVQRIILDDVIRPTNTEMMHACYSDQTNERRKTVSQ